MKPLIDQKLEKSQHEKKGLGLIHRVFKRRLGRGEAHIVNVHTVR